MGMVGLVMGLVETELVEVEVCSCLTSMNVFFAMPVNSESSRKLGPE